MTCTFRKEENIRTGAIISVLALNNRKTISKNIMEK